jgi:hypothetical protein
MAQDQGVTPAPAWVERSETDVMKAFAIAHQFEHVMMVVGRAEVQVLRFRESTICRPQRLT